MAFRGLLPGVISGSATGPWDVSTAVYDSVSFVTSEDSFMFSMKFKPDGTKMYLFGTQNDTVYQYSLSSAWDINTASYDGVSFSVGSQDSNINGINFKPDGTRMYAVGSTNDSVYQYNLSTAWLLSSASYSGVSFSVASQDSSPESVAFKPDGNVMYVCGDANNRVYQYNLLSAWSLSSVSYTGKSLLVSTQESNPKGIAFKPDGTKVYVIGSGSDSVNQYALTTAWDLTTASFETAYNVGSDIDAATGLTSIVYDLAFKDDGKKMYVLDYITDDVYQFSLG